MKTLSFAVLAAALMLCNGCALLWLGDGGEDAAQGSSSTTGPTSSSSSGTGTGGDTGTGGGDGGTCTPVTGIDRTGETTGCDPAMLGTKGCSVDELKCDETACSGACQNFSLCTSAGWAAKAYCESGSLVVIGPPDAGMCTPVSGIDKTGETTGCDPSQLPKHACNVDDLCQETECDGTCQNYSLCTPNGWESKAYCNGPQLVIL